jgi:hypothetical protein
VGKAKRAHHLSRRDLVTMVGTARRRSFAHPTAAARVIFITFCLAVHRNAARTRAFCRDIFGFGAPLNLPPQP